MSGLEEHADVAAVVAFLADGSNAGSAARFSSSLTGVNQSGLYSWWVDAEGAELVARPFGVAIGPLI